MWLSAGLHLSSLQLRRMQRRPFSHPKTPRWAKGTSTWNCTICKKMLIRWRVCLFYLNPQLDFPCAASGYCANHLFSYWHYSICNMPYCLTYTCHLGTAHLWRNCCGYCWLATREETVKMYFPLQFCLKRWLWWAWLNKPLQRLLERLLTGQWLQEL